MSTALMDLLGVDEGERAWMVDGACAEVSPDLWFPERGASAKPAKRICAGCEVRVECLEYAMRHQEPGGVWGGLTARERKQARDVSRGAAPGVAVLWRPTPHRQRVVELIREGHRDFEIAALTGCPKSTVARIRARTEIAA